MTTVDTLERIVELRGRAPKLIRCDNGPKLVSQSLRDWCRFNHTGAGYIEPRRTMAESIRRILQRRGRRAPG